MIVITYEELERRCNDLTEESGKKIKHALTEARRNLSGLRYSEIEMFLLICEREMKKNCDLSRLGFENPPKI
jgi:predicted site-specific integrase-resolvase